ncbi:class I SAM-dependent methyltransferase [candidate division CSSED10-310 bacterium]|uniref:Class I SAM-dependent methyltransferase n=1 Tax=candidate division CSSED10-310 bacterium TaxID=2855610 RepID=A0ABV6YV01_UNCC1
MNIICPLCTYDDLRFLGKRSDLVTAERIHQEYYKFVEDVSLFDRGIYKCLVCGFQFVYPQYNQADLAALYNQDGYGKSQEAWSPLSEFKSSFARDLINEWKTKYTSLGVVSWREEFQANNKRTPTFLDVGCGRGQDLLVFHELGFEVTGIDVSDYQIEFARNHLNFNLVKTSLDDFKPVRKFDCILASHVIEHVVSPHSFIDDLLRLMNPEGLLLLETPLIFDGGREQDRYRDIYHTLFFDHFSLTVLALMHGLQVKNIIHVNYKDDLEYHIFILFSLACRDNPVPNKIDRSFLEAFRACHEGMHQDFCKWGRYYSAASRWRRAWRLWQQQGFLPALRRSLHFLKKLNS